MTTARRPFPFARRAWLAARLPDLALLALALFLSAAVKRHYAVATPGELRFILAPTAFASETLLGHEFVWLPDSGYFSDELSFLIAPACAGVNFWVIAFLVLAGGFVPRLGSTKRKALWLAASALIAFAAAVVVNSLRIVLSVAVAHEASRHLGLSFQAAHRLLGVSVYFGGLLVLVLVTDAVFRRGKDATAARNPLVLALGVYLGVTLLVPLARGNGSAPEYWDHAASVAVLALALGGAAASARAAFGAIRRKASGTSPRPSHVG